MPHPLFTPEVRQMLETGDTAEMRAFCENLHPATIAGALMTTDYAWLPASITASEAIERLRQLAPTSETIYYVYVLDESTRRLLGVVSLRDLIIAPRQARVRDLMGSIVGALRVTDDRE